MHVYEEYQAPSRAAMLDVLRCNPFGLLVTTAVDDRGPVPVATHLPVLVPPATDPGLDAMEDPFDGLLLWGHMGRANPQWRHFEHGGRGLVVVNGPHRYVSPTTYDVDPAAPTWNYVAVHLTVALAPLWDDEDALAVVRATVDLMERQQAEPWDDASSEGYFRQIVRGVTAFTARVEHATAVFKMSQDKDDDVYGRVHRAAERDDPALAHAMDVSNPGRTGRCPAG
ncbi:FMN-binding negative transcriptional regulator [Pseudokineococcus sp. 1T1Z-3]|uniref:FMN-binding negative transcriptional regulator n=1 Tax=Pseudokineococcus sp. 1T1Z-3 TaxID=3132745 RepID=UPI0030A364BF